MSINKGSFIYNKYSSDIMMVVSADLTDKVPVYEAKWLNTDGTLSGGSLIIIGSQMEDYELLESETSESLADDFRNMDSAIAGFFSSIYK